LHDLAAEFKVSAERIRQIEAKALEKMRKSMQSADGPMALPAPA
jgi:RNA polymerase sigma-32 factor